VKWPLPLKWRNFIMPKYSFIPARNISFICSKILYKDFLRRTVSVDFSQRCSKIFYKQIKCRVLHKINEKSRAGINGYFYIKNPLLWEWHLYFPFCELCIWRLFLKVARDFSNYFLHTTSPILSKSVNKYI
jgi:hypothetical protein